jgi:ubiquinol oxidase
MSEVVFYLPRPKVLTSQDISGDDCTVFVGTDGEVQEVMCCDYGFRSGFGRLYQGGDGEIPKNFFALVSLFRSL